MMEYIWYNKIMRDEDRLYFQECEEQKNHELDSLFDDWIKQLEKNETPIHNGNYKKTSPSDCFAKDGFFPGYFNQKKRVCFIGRETRFIGGKDFRETTIDDYFNRFENKNNWWRHILYIVYGIKNDGKLAYENIPSADEILAEMKKEENYGFAVINISKYSNDDETSWQTNKDLVHRFLEDSDLEKTNFFERELQILDPDVIITANLWDGTIDTKYLNLCLPNKDFSPTKTISHDKEKVAEYGKYSLNGKSIDFIDLYHFAAVKSDKYCFYNPVMKTLFNKT